MVHLSKKEAEGFYIVHKERPFYGSLTEFMSRGPVVLMVLEGENSIAKNREIMGATNPEQAEAGTIRKDFATNIDGSIFKKDNLLPLRLGIHRRRGAYSDIFPSS